MTLNPAVWHIATSVPPHLAATAEAAFTERFAAVSAFEVEEGGDWRIEAYQEAKPDLAELCVRLALAAAAAGLPEPLVSLERLPPTDWLAATVEAFPPFRVGRFYIHGSHVPPVRPAGSVRLCIDAATAFGSGEHPTTEGCLRAIEGLAKAHRPRRLLDMGCGTGILAFAAVRMMGRGLAADGARAADSDARSCLVARHNARVNGLSHRVRVRHSRGFADRTLRRAAPYDLVLANILARPLVGLAGDVARHTAPGARVVLSGLLRRQVPMVLAAYRARGLPLRRRVDIGAWSTLVLVKR